MASLQKDFMGYQNSYRLIPLGAVKFYDWYKLWRDTTEVAYLTVIVIVGFIAPEDAVHYCRVSGKIVAHPPTGQLRFVAAESAVNQRRFFIIVNPPADGTEHKNNATIIVSENN